MRCHLKKLKLALVTAALAVTVCACGKESDKIQDYDAVLIAEIHDDAYGDSSLYKDKSEDYIYEVKDNKIINKITNTGTYDTSELMRINEEVSKSDITLKDQYTTDTYEATLEESSAHVKHLQDKGYKITRLVNTQEFIDINLSKDEDLKRMVIYPDKVIVSSIEYKEFKIENYIKD